jgi:glycerol-3-phosphate acyltransferase PlsY
MGGAAIIGHMYPIYYRFQGGKGVATTLGVLLAIHWPLALIWSGVWVSMAKLSRYSSLSALTATALLPLVAWSLGLSIEVISLLVIISILVFWRHRSNITKLIHGQESRISGSK